MSGLAASTQDMKHFFVTLSILAIGAATAPAALIHHYTFNGAVIDQAGTVDGLLHGNAVAYGGTLTLDGYFDYVSFGSNYLVPTNGTFSVALWAQFDYDGNVHEFISQGQSGGPGFYIGPYGNEMRAGDVYGWSATPHFSTGSCAGICTGIEAPSDSLWHHYTLTVNAGNAAFYVDGVQRGTRSNYAISGTGAPTYLGTQFGGSGEFLNGQMRDVRIYDHALAGNEIENITGTPEPGTLALMAGALHLIWYRSKRR